MVRDVPGVPCMPSTHVTQHCTSKLFLPFELREKRARLHGLFGSCAVHKQASGLRNEEYDKLGAMARDASCVPCTSLCVGGELTGVNCREQTGACGEEDAIGGQQVLRRDQHKRGAFGTSDSQAGSTDIPVFRPLSSSHHTVSAPPPLHTH